MTQADEFRKAIQKQQVYKLGASPLVWHVMGKLEIESTLDTIPTDREVSNGQAGTAMTLNRLLRPKALYRIERWLDASGLDKLMAHEAEAFNDDCLGRMLDDISEHTEELWLTIVGRAIECYPEVAGETIHYDITSCYFEGAYEESELAQYGYSRDHRSDTKQVNLGLSVMGKSGVPLMYELLAGNTADNQTPMAHIAKLKKLFERVKALSKMIFVGDRAMLNQKLIAGYLKEEDVGFLGPWTPAEVREIIAGVPEEELMGAPLQYRPQSARPDAPPSYYGVLREVTFTYEEGAEEHTETLRLLVMYSRSKARLDKQKREDHLARASEALQDIQSKLNVRRYKRGCYVEQRIANELKKAPAARGLIDWRLGGVDGALTLTFTQNDEAIKHAADVDGRYALVTNTDISADDMLVAFKRQCLAEGRFSVIKGPVPIRPVHLRSDRRIRALVFLTMLALLIYTILEWLVRQETPGRRRPWTGRAILEVFEEWMVAVQFFTDGSHIWLPPPLSDDQRTIWTALGLPDVEVFLAQFFRWNMKCGT